MDGNLQDMTAVAAPPHHACAFAEPQGINRLGKAAPRPGSLRPPDPTRNRITDHFSENIEGLESDRDYQRAVQDVSQRLMHRDVHSTTRSVEEVSNDVATECWELKCRGCACRLRTRSRPRGGCLAEEVRLRRYDMPCL